MTGLRYSPLHVTELCGEMQGNFKVGCARLINLPPGWYTHRYGGGKQAVGPSPGRLGLFLGREEGVGPPLT